MKKNDLTKLRQSNITELNQQIRKLEVELVNKKAELKLGKLKDVKAVKNLRAQRAIIKTIITEKQLQTQGDGE